MATAEHCPVTGNYSNLLLQEITLFKTEAVRPANQKPLAGNNNVDETCVRRAGGTQRILRLDTNTSNLIPFPFFYRGLARQYNFMF